MSKLTVNIASDVLARAKGYAHQRGTSVSRLVESYLDVLARPIAIADQDLPPITRRLRGLLKVDFDRKNYIEHLVRKHR